MGCKSPINTIFNPVTSPYGIPIEFGLILSSKVGWVVVSGVQSGEETRFKSRVHGFGGERPTPAGAFLVDVTKQGEKVVD